MKPKRWQPFLPALALPLLTAGGVAQMTGVAHPDDTAAEVQSAPAAQAIQTDHYVMPSKGVLSKSGSNVTAGYTANPIAHPATAIAPAGSGEPVAYAATGPVPAADTPQIAQPAPGLIVRQSAPAAAPGSYYVPAQTPAARAESQLSAANDDSGIVTEVPAAPFELPAGTVLKTRLDNVLGTQTTPVGSHFTAQLLADAGHKGQVLLPAGSAIHGRVTAVHGGRRISGGASIRLQPQTVTLPDGTTYALRATVTALESGDDLKVNDEGVINAYSNAKATAGVIGGVTAVAAVTGAVVGGGVGAVVGAGIGAGVGTVVWLRQDQQATLPRGTTLFFALDEPLQLNPR